MPFGPRHHSAQRGERVANLGISWNVRPNDRVLIVGVDHELEGDFFFLRDDTTRDFYVVWSEGYKEEVDSLRAYAPC